MIDFAKLSDEAVCEAYLKIRSELSRREIEVTFHVGQEGDLPATTFRRTVEILSQ